MKVCEICKKSICELQYDLTDYVYKYRKYIPETTKYEMLYFCSYKCYKEYINERNRQDKLNNIPKEVHQV